jgi:N-acetylmuramoyl-L-alanine amidase
MNGVIFIDPGHGGGDHGAKFLGLKEKDVNLDLSLALYDALMKHNYMPFLTRSADWRTQLFKRCYLANKIYNNLSKDYKKLAVFVSIHCNADPDPDEAGDPEAFGKEIWYYKAGLPLAESLQTAMHKFFPDEKFRGLKQSKQLYVLRHTEMPTALVELGFIDCVEMNKKLRNPLYKSRLIDWLFNGINNHLTAVREKEVKNERV